MGQFITPSELRLICATHSGEKVLSMLKSIRKNDDEESIPPDGSLITLEQTDENTVYIGPYDPKASKN